MSKSRDAETGRFVKTVLTGVRKKVCKCCGRKLWLREFYKMSNRRNYPDGYDRYCKECERKEKNARYVPKRKDGVYLNADGQAVEKRGNSVRLSWGEERIKDFKRLFPFTTNEDMAIDFGCSVRTVVRRAREWGLEKDQQWLKALWHDSAMIMVRENRVFGNKADLTNFIEGGKVHRFKPGHAPLQTKEQHSEAMKRAWQRRKRTVSN